MDAETPTVRCVWRGTAFYDAQGELTRLRGGRGTVEGFDPETGETTWSVDIAADAVEDAYTDRGQKVAGERTVLVRTEDGPRVVDIATGAATPTDESTTFTCAGEVATFDYAMAYFVDGEPTHGRYAGRLHHPCDADGAERDFYTVAAVEDGGQDAGDGLRVIAGAGGLAGFDLGG